MYLRTCGFWTRMAFRRIIRHPLMYFQIIAILGTTFGILGASLSIVKGFYLDSLPFLEAQRLVKLENFSLGFQTTVNEFDTWRQNSSYLEDAVALFTTSVNSGVGNDVQRVQLAEVSSNFFEFFGTVPLVGSVSSSTFRDHSAIVAASFWRQSLGESRDVIGRTLLINGVPFIIVGIVNDDRAYPGGVELWTPTALFSQTIPKSGVFFYEFLGRLRVGLQVRDAQELHYEELGKRNVSFSDGDKTYHQVIPLRRYLSRDSRAEWIAFLIGCIFVISLAIASITGLCFVDALSRRDEFKVRAACGADSVSLRLQCLCEGLLFGIGSSILALVVGNVVSQSSVVVGAMSLVFGNAGELGVSVTLVILLCCVLCGVLFGCVPLIVSSDAVGRIGVALLGARVLRSHTAQGLIVSVQVALSVALFFGTLSSTQAVISMMRANMGFRTSDLVTLGISFDDAFDERVEYGGGFFDKLLERFERIPGVVSVTASQFIPYGENAFSGVEVHLGDVSRSVLAVSFSVASNYFSVTESRILYGRAFRDSEEKSRAKVVVVSATLARRLGRPELLIGRTLYLGRSGRSVVIVGVSEDQRLMGRREDMVSQVFFPIRQDIPSSFYLLIRKKPDAIDITGFASEAVREMDRRAAVFDSKLMKERIYSFYRGTVLRVIVLAGLTLFASLLAVLGNFAMMGALVSSQVSHLAVRFAVGGSFEKIRFAFFRMSFSFCVSGLILGLLSCFFLESYVVHLVGRTAEFNFGLVSLSVICVLFPNMIAAWLGTGFISERRIVSMLRSL